MSQSEGAGTLAETASLDVRRVRPEGAGAYLLVVTKHSSTMFPLPELGVVLIGRGQHADLRIDDASVSREHARIVVEGHEVRVVDLGSHNGTRINGQPVEGTRVVTSGDVIAMGELVLVVQAAARPPDAPAVLEESAWRSRLAIEIERALEFRRPLAVLAATGMTPATAVTLLRTIDIVGRGEVGDVLAILPEAEPEEARQLALQLVDHPGARVGIASCSYDAIDADNLLLAARNAARVADRVAPASAAAERRVLGDREVLVSHPSMVRVFELLKRLAAVTLPVLIVGETGVGKENAAFAVHHYSPRATKPFVALNCAALPEQLVESQLFGHDRGAFTGANVAREGLLETVAGGTLFLDEVGELSLSTQAKLLRAIETQRITRIGEHRERPIDARFVAATNRVLEAEVEAGRFRRDLFFRLGGAKVFIPPLRDRGCEIPLLFHELLAQAAARSGRTAPTPTAAVLRALLAYRWPGNVRELVHLAEYLAATVIDDRIEVDDLSPELAAVAGPRPTTTVAPSRGESSGPVRRLADEIEELEKRRIAEALAQAGGVKAHAAQLLGVPIRTFQTKLKQYGFG